MADNARLREAIAKAKAGRELSARDLFVGIVRDDPDNKLAWLWLMGLLDDTNDLIIACEAVLRIDPLDKRVASRLKKIRRAEKENKKREEDVILGKIDILLAQGNIELALTRLRRITRENRNSETAWILLAKHTTNLVEKERALARIYALDSENKEKESALRRVRYFCKNPLELAVSYEEVGQIDEAIKVYEGLTTKARGRSEWDRLIREINRLEGLKNEKIVYISSKLTIARLSLGAPLLFLSLIVIQMGYDFRYASFLMGVEFLMVVLGAFLAAVAVVGSEHRIWHGLGSPDGRGTIRWRRLVGAAGITIMVLPFILFSLEAYARWVTVIAYIGFDY